MNCRQCSNTFLCLSDLHQRLYNGLVACGSSNFLISLESVDNNVNTSAGQHEFMTVTTVFALDQQGNWPPWVNWSITFRSQGVAAFLIWNFLKNTFLLRLWALFRSLTAGGQRLKNSWDIPLETRETAKISWTAHCKQTFWRPWSSHVQSTSKWQIAFKGGGHNALHRLCFLLKHLSQKIHFKNSQCSFTWPKRE